MAAFHKPKVYRSADGCCICKAKSSSSRFTASAKYEGNFESCFHISSSSLGEEEKKRGGDICNACVLLVKRYRKLPANSDRHWAHVVGARAGPGVKNFVKVRRRESCRERARERDYAKKHVWRRKKQGTSKRRGTGGDSEEWSSGDTSSTEEPQLSGFLDPSVWSRREVCCGTIFVSSWGEAMVDPRFLNLPCQKHGKPSSSTSGTSSSSSTSATSSSSLSSLSSSSSSSSTSSSCHPTPSSSPSTSTSSFLAIEKIIESELQSLEKSQLKTKVHEEGLDDDDEEDVEEDDDTGAGDTDADEGFFDKPSISPVFNKDTNVSGSRSETVSKGIKADFFKNTNTESLN